MRKTVNVEALTVTINRMLAVSTCSAEMRHGMINVLEGVLHDSGNYRGYRYLLLDEVPLEELPGLNQEVDANGNVGVCADYTARFANTDGTRRQY